jgi:hypothetical protein
MAEDQTFLGEVLKQESRIGQYCFPVYVYDQTHSNHLTKNDSAIQDIQKAVNTNVVRYFQDQKDLDIYSILVCKQVLTSLKLLPKVGKMAIVYQFAKLISKANWVQRKSIYRSTVKIIRTRESQYEKI